METLWRWNNLASVLIKDITGATSTYSNISKVALQSVYGGQAIFHENGGGGGVQSDWNQNNPEESSHILNRPFYSEYEYITTELTEKNTATYTELSSNGSLYYNVTLFEQVAWNQNINENDNFQLIWDNVVFNKINDNFIKPIIKNNVIYFGNLNLFDQNENDNNFYFCIALFPKGSHPDYLDSYVIESRTKETQEEHSYQINKIETINETIHTLDKKYLPEGIGTQPDWNETDTDSLAYIQNKPEIPEVLQSNWDQVNSFELDFIKNKPFGKKANIVNDGIYNFTTYDLNSSKYLSSEIIPYFKEAKEGDICLVRFNGIDYEVPYKTREGTLFAANGNRLGTITELSLGNIGLRAFSYGTIVADDPSDSIYPFYISEQQSAASSAGKFQVYITLKDNIKTIDKQYLLNIQPDWNDLDVNSLSYIQNRPFGEVPKIIKYGTYNFSNSGVNGIYISDSISVDYIPEEYDEIRIVWGQTTYNCEVRIYSYKQESGYDYIYVYGIGNPNLCIVNNKLGQLSSSNSSTLPFFIDLTNKKVYSNSNQEIKVSAYLSTEFKYLDSKYLKGELLPKIDRNFSSYVENHTMVVDSGGVWRSSTIPPQDWNDSNPFINSFIFNKPCYETYENIVDIKYSPWQLFTETGIEGGFAGAIMDSLQSLQVGKYYYIIMNGSTFRAKCRAGNVDSNIEFQFGNDYLADNEVADTGENFYIAITNLRADDDIAGRALFTSVVYCRGFTGGPHIAIREKNTLKVKKLDSKYLSIDKTLTKTNYVADAKATGDLINSMKNLIQDLQNQVNILTQRIAALENGNSTIPEVFVSGETLYLESGLINDESLELTYGEVQNESLIFNNYSSNSNATVIEDELNVSGSIDIENNEILTSSGIVTADGVWEV